MWKMVCKGNASFIDLQQNALPWRNPKTLKALYDRATGVPAEMIPDSAAFAAYGGQVRAQARTAHHPSAEKHSHPRCDGTLQRDVDYPMSWVPPRGAPAICNLGRSSVPACIRSGAGRRRGT